MDYCTGVNYLLIGFCNINGITHALFGSSPVSQKYLPYKAKSGTLNGSTRHSNGSSTVRTYSAIILGGKSWISEDRWRLGILVVK